MKKLIPFIIITFSVFILNSCFKANDNVGHDGRCTGSSYCSACSNCSGCAHCSSGGSCGVCSGGSPGNSSKKSRSKRQKTSASHTASKNKSRKPSRISIDEININLGNNNRYIAGMATTNIYKNPSLKSKIIERVSKNTKLIQLSTEKPWYKVKNQKSGNTGYVYYKDVK